MAENIEDRVKKIISEKMDVPEDKISTQTSFVNDLGADSLDTVELVMQLEDEFDIKIPEDDAERIQTVGQAVEYISNELQKSAS